jgi:sugar-specific transcriptional regulator TrmB
MRIPYQEKDFFLLLKETDYFDALEIKILKAMLALREDGNNTVTASNVSKQAKISVTNAYKYLYSLQEKGLVEMKEVKNKVFWLSESSNPFPRLASVVGREFLRKKKVFDRLKLLYDSHVNIGNVWRNEKVKTEVSDIEDKTAFIIDAAKEELLITVKSFYEDFVVLDALKRAVARGIKIRMVIEQTTPRVLDMLEKMKIDVRMGICQQPSILADSRHGMIIDDKQGMMFLNYITTYKPKFEKMWEDADQF